jgi:hypothetical protein
VRGGFRGDGLGKAIGRSSSDVFKRRGDVLAAAAVLHGIGGDRVVCPAASSHEALAVWQLLGWPRQHGLFVALVGIRRKLEDFVIRK